MRYIPRKESRCFCSSIPSIAAHPLNPIFVYLIETISSSVCKMLDPTLSERLLTKGTPQGWLLPTVCLFWVFREQKQVLNGRLEAAIAPFAERKVTEFDNVGEHGCPHFRCREWIWCNISLSLELFHGSIFSSQPPRHDDRLHLFLELFGCTKVRKVS